MPIEDLDYSAALRVVNGDSHLAQDVTQMVFIELARGVGSLPRDQNSGNLSLPTRQALVVIPSGYSQGCKWSIH